MHPVTWALFSFSRFIAHSMFCWCCHVCGRYFRPIIYCLCRLTDCFRLVSDVYFVILNDRSCSQYEHSMPLLARHADGVLVGPIIKCESAKVRKWTCVNCESVMRKISQFTHRHLESIFRTFALSVKRASSPTPLNKCTTRPMKPSTSCYLVVV